jgi:hypothetical protein
MNRRYAVLIGVLVQFINCVAFADRPLDRTEILQIFRKLTSQPRKTWIPAGTIEATHEEYKAAKTTDPEEMNTQINQAIQKYRDNPNKRELTEDLQKMRLDAIPFNVRYKLSNEYTITSSVTVRFDGDRFYWEINVDSRTDSIKPGKDLEGNFMTEQFNLDWNARRIFAWDAEKYTTYALPGNQAIVDTRASTPHVISGPLTAGFIPWGYGYYSYDNLVGADSSAVEKLVNGQAQIYLQLDHSNGGQMLFVMDPQKDYAVISCWVSSLDNSKVYKQYGDYRLISGNWVPTTIYIEQYDGATNKLLAYDLWRFTKISVDVPMVGSFDVKYETDALVEYFSYLTDKPLMYRYCRMVDTEFILAERLAVAADEGIQPQNCATVALKYVASRLDKKVTEQQLAQLAREPDKTTSLYAMKKLAESLGLYCRAVKTDIQTLKSLSGCEAILHFPGKNHFVVLAGIDSQNVWCIDLVGDEFLYRTDLNFFGMDWTEGVALLFSNQPVQIYGGFTEIDDLELARIIGGDGYICTALRQEYNVIYCSEAFGLCGAYYEEYYERYGCEAASSGSCRSSVMIRYKESPCIEKPDDPWNCTVTGEWTYYYMRACA